MQYGFEIWHWDSFLFSFPRYKKNISGNFQDFDWLWVDLEYFSYSFWLSRDMWECYGTNDSVPRALDNFTASIPLVAIFHWFDFEIFFKQRSHMYIVGSIFDVHFRNYLHGPFQAETWVGCNISRITFRDEPLKFLPIDKCGNLCHLLS